MSASLGLHVRHGQSNSPGGYRRWCNRHESAANRNTQTRARIPGYEVSQSPRHENQGDSDAAVEARTGPDSAPACSKLEVCTRRPQENHGINQAISLNLGPATLSRTR